MRRSILLCLGTVLFTVSSLIAQDAPKFEVFGGYSYFNADSNSLTARQSLHGWEASLTGNANQYVGVEVSGSGYYKNNVLDSGVDVRDYAILGGPRLNYRNFFVHALFGFDHLVGSYAGLSASQNGFAMALGGGAVAPLTKHFGVRASFDYAMTQHNVIGNTRFDQNNFRISAGVVFRFGGIGERASRRTGGGRAATAPTTTAGQISVSPTSPVQIAALGITVTQAADNRGVEIVDVDPNGPAAKAGMVRHDVIVNMNGHDVHTVAELNAALAKTGENKIRYMYLGTPSYMTVTIGREQ